MALMICGHPRSGTTLLRNLCHLHPDVAVTNEFGAFKHLGASYAEYSGYVRDRWRAKGLAGHKTLVTVGPHVRRALPLHLARRHAFTARYLFGLWTARARTPDVSLVDGLYRASFPGARVCGDKLPDYVFDLDEYVAMDGLSIVAIYRDCRDVASSALQKARVDWQKNDRGSYDRMRSPERIADRWVRSIELMEKHRRRIHIIQYEELVRKPREVLPALAAFLGVEADGFPMDRVRDKSIGRYRERLSEDELSVVEDLAGPTMRRLGYVS